MLDYSVTYDQSEFFRYSQAVDWGVLVTLWQGSAQVCVCAMGPEETARVLREAADAIQADAAP